MNSYQERINKVLNHIDFNLDEKQDLDNLADIACLSKFHFHRIMSSYLGEPIGSYINRLKIETGAKLLKYSSSSISEIAYKIGFETPTSFNKSFKKLFKLSPSDFRKGNVGTFSITKKNKVDFNFQITTEIKTIQPFKILCNQSKGIIGDKKTYDCWSDLLLFSYENGLIDEYTKFIAIHWDDPSITSEKNLRYDACISLPDEFSLKSKYAIKKNIGGKYLCVLYQGDYKNLPDVYTQIFRDYIFKTNYLLRDEPIFEEFLNSINNTPPNKLLTIIHIPIY